MSIHFPKQRGLKFGFLKVWFAYNFWSVNLAQVRLENDMYDGELRLVLQPWQFWIWTSREHKMKVSSFGFQGLGPWTAFKLVTFWLNNGDFQIKSNAFQGWADPNSPCQTQSHQTFEKVRQVETYMF